MSAVTSPIIFAFWCESVSDVVLCFGILGKFSFSATELLQKLKHYLSLSLHQYCYSHLFYNWHKKCHCDGLVIPD